jgi:hypothetical protein
MAVFRGVHGWPFVPILPNHWPTWHQRPSQARIKSLSQTLRHQRIPSLDVFDVSMLRTMTRLPKEERASDLALPPDERTTKLRNAADSGGSGVPPGRTF